MADLFVPDNISQIGYACYQFGTPLQEAQVYPSLGREWHDESGTSVDGRYQKHTGETHAVGVAKRMPTYLDTTTGLVGTKFHVVHGNVVDDFYHDVYHTSCLGFTSGAPSTVDTDRMEVVSVDAFADIEHSEIWLQWGDPPVSTDGNDYSHDRAKRYTTVELAYASPDKQNYRVRFEYGQPIALDVMYDGVNWELGVAVLKDLGNFERYREAHKDGVTLKVIPDISFRIIGVEVGDGHMLTHKVDASKLKVVKSLTSFADSDHALPRNGKIRVVHRNGTLKFAYFPERFQELTVTKSALDLSGKVIDPSGLSLRSNSLGTVPAGQTDSSLLVVDNGKVSWKTTSTLPDSGDGLGSKVPAVHNDATIMVAPRWGNRPTGAPEELVKQVARLDSYWVEEVQRWNHINRTLTTDAVLHVENGDGRWDGLFGNLALNIQATNDGGNSYFQRLQGFVYGDAKDGIEFIRRDPVRYMKLRGICKRRQMQVPLNARVMFDHWAWPSVVRFLANKAGVHPAFLKSIPLYIPPGATEDAPYGKAGYDCPYYILPSGFGTKPLFEYGPEAIIWDILQFLVQFLNAGYDSNGRRYTWYMGFTNDGQFHFEGVELYNLPLAMSYATVDPTGLGLIEGELRVINDTGDLRTAVDFFGIDAQSYELIFEHREAPWQVKLVKGFHESWTERSAAFCSEEFTRFSADEALWQCSIPTQGVLFQAKFLPFMNAGALIAVTDESIEGGTGLYSIETLISRYGIKKENNQRDCHSIIFARSLAATY